MFLWLLGYFIIHVVPFVISSTDNLPEFLVEDEIDCNLNTENWLKQIWIPWGTPNRAYFTIPPGVKLTNSSIPGAGLGIVATTFIPRFTWLAEYEGEVVLDDNHISHYAWAIYRDGEEYFNADGYNESTSNWVRWVNCARHAKEQNIKSKLCRGKIYYVTYKDIYPGQELLVYYGPDYAEYQLQIDTDNYYNLDVDINLYKMYSCWNIRID